MHITDHNRKWWTLGAVSLGLFMIMLDNTVVNVALPTIQRDLGASLASLEWVVSGYALTFAALLLTGGRLADVLGRRRTFVAGLAVFSLSSLACALAPSTGLLIGARLVQGCGAALMNPASLSIVTATFPPEQRGMAIGTWAGVSATALAIGPLVGGLLTEHVGWSAIFYVNVPVGALAIVASLLLIEEPARAGRRARLDVPGLASSALCLFALTFALIEGNGHGWTSSLIVGAFATAAVALAAFLVLERRSAAPMLDLGLFREPAFAGANVVVLLIGVALFGVFFFVSLYIQDVLGYSPVRAGAAFLPMTVLVIVLAPIAGRVFDRIGPRRLVTGGMLLVAAQLAYFSSLGVHETFWALLPGMLLGGVGVSVVLSPSTAAALRSVPAHQGGVAAAVVNSARQTGGSLGIALMGAIMAHDLGGRHSPAAFVHAFSATQRVGALIALAGAAVAAVSLRSRPEHDARSPAREAAVA